MCNQQIGVPIHVGNFLFSGASKLALGPTQPPIQQAMRALPSEVKQPGHISVHSPPSNAIDCIEICLFETFFNMVNM